MIKRLFTSESVTEGHPDKLCDQLSDAVVDRMLETDPMSRVACECSVTTNFLLVTGEITTEASVDIEATVRKAINEIGYIDKSYGIDGNTCEVLIKLDKQSTCIKMGVDESFEAKRGEITDKYNTGAGDQGMMFGYACDETPELMPAPISTAHKLVQRLTDVRKKGILPYLRPDGKSQVTFEYIDDKPARVEAVVISAHHAEDIDIAKLRSDIEREVIKAIIPANLIDRDTKLHINPTGRFVIGGPLADSGLTGRKIIVDTYGGYSRHGGGAFSGKDPTKVDRSAAYAARYLAKNVVAAGLARKSEIQIAYAIGVANPVSVRVDTFGTGSISEEKITAMLMNNFDFRPAAIIDKFNLRRPIYQATAAYGHMGRDDLNVPWEALDLVGKLII